VKKRRALNNGGGDSREDIQRLRVVNEASAYLIWWHVAMLKKHRQERRKRRGAKAACAGESGVGVAGSPSSFCGRRRRPLDSGWLADARRGVSGILGEKLEAP